MSIPFRTVSLPVSFEAAGIALSGTIEASRTMMTGSLTVPCTKPLSIVQIPLHCLSGSKTGLVNEDFTGLSKFGLRVARRELERMSKMELGKQDGGAE